MGKTTVLEAIRVHAARGHPNVLWSVLNKHEEMATVLDDDLDPVAFPDYAALFRGRVAIPGQPIVIGPKSGGEDLRIELSKTEDRSTDQRMLFDDPSRDSDVRALKVTFRKKEKWVAEPFSGRNWPLRRPALGRVRDSWTTARDRWDWPRIECESLGPGLASNSKLARFWDSVALTSKEDLSLEALRLANGEIERVAIVGDDPRFRGRGRRVIVKLRDYRDPVPLASLGDGITRLFAAGLALAASRGGYLVVDEVENGIHYSVQQDFWSMVLHAANQHHVQVLATTHSNDCVAGFARAAADLDQVESAYVRLERIGRQVKAVEYAKEDLYTVAEQGIEAR